MAPTSQPLLQGGMRTRDWFSDKLGGEGGREEEEGEVGWGDGGGTLMQKMCEGI